MTVGIVDAPSYVRCNTLPQEGWQAMPDELAYSVSHPCMLVAFDRNHLVEIFIDGDPFMKIFGLTAETLRVSPPTGPSLTPRDAFLAHLGAATGAAVAVLIPVHRDLSRIRLRIKRPQYVVSSKRS